MALIYITRHIPEIGINLLRAAGHTVEVGTGTSAPSEKELIKAVSGQQFSAVITLLTDPVTDAVMKAVPTAKIFANYAVGFNNIDMRAAHENGVTVTNTPDVLTDSVAEFTLALMCALVRRIPEADTYARAKKYTGWEPELFLGADLKGKTLGIVGAGRIGSAFASRAHHGLGMRILYSDVKKNTALQKETEAVLASSLDELFACSDIISIHVPATADTEHLVNEGRLKLMKKTAYLINTARGNVIDEQALAIALKTGMIRGAGIDVFEKEPEICSELLTLPNVILTPHIASATEETRARMSEVAAQNVIDFLAGEKPDNIVSA